MSPVVANDGHDGGGTSSAILLIFGVITIVTTFMGPFLIRIGSRFELGEPKESDPEKDEEGGTRKPTSREIESQGRSHA